jgi:hypothetical protein
LTKSGKPYFPIRAERASRYAEAFSEGCGFKTGKSALAQVQDEMLSAIDAYLDITEDEVSQNFGPQLGALLPILNTVNNLLDLDTYLEPVVKQAGLVSKAVLLSASKVSEFFTWFLFFVVYQYSAPELCVVLVMKYDCGACMLYRKAFQSSQINAEA